MNIFDGVTVLLVIEFPFKKLMVATHKQIRTVKYPALHPRFTLQLVDGCIPVQLFVCYTVRMSKTVCKCEQQTSLEDKEL